MSMHIQVQAIVGEGFNGAWRAGRKWPAAEPIVVEVIDQDEDPPALEEEITVEGVKKTRTTPNPTRIGRKSYELLKADSRLRILSDKETSANQSDAALNRARQLASAAQAENSDLKVKLAGLEDDNKRLRQQLTDAGITPGQSTEERRAAAQPAGEEQAPAPEGEETAGEEEGEHATGGRRRRR